MPIDPNGIKWDDAPKFDSAGIKWDEPVAASIGDQAPDFGEAKVRPGEIENAAHTLGMQIAPNATRTFDTLPQLTSKDVGNEFAQALMGPFGSSDVARTAASKLIPAAPIAGGAAGLATGFMNNATGGLGNELAAAFGHPLPTPGDAVENVSQALSYDPQTPAGKAVGAAIDVPFEALGTAGKAAGGKVMDKTNSPLLATLADTAVNALPMLFGADKAGKALEPTAPPKDVFKTQQAETAANPLPTGTDVLKTLTDDVSAKLKEAVQTPPAPNPVTPAAPPVREGRAATQKEAPNAVVDSGAASPNPAQPGAVAPEEAARAAALDAKPDAAPPLPSGTPVDASASVPLAGGISHEAGGPQVVIDKRVPRYVTVEDKAGNPVQIDVHEAIASHERTEHPIMHKDGEDYAAAHDVATKAENAFVAQKYNVDPQKYQAALTDAIKKAREEAPQEPGSIPQNLDTKPYTDEGDGHLLPVALDTQRMAELRQKRDAGTITPDEHAELNKHLETALTTADVGGEHVPGLLNQVGRAQLEQSGKMKPYRAKTDIDDFKEVNDTLGHDIGDEVLKAKAQAMVDAFGPGNAWREGGDEFGAHADTPEELHAGMAKVKQAMKDLVIEGVDQKGRPVSELPMGVSYGVGKGETPKLAAKAADNDLYVNKAARTASGERRGRRSTDAQEVGQGVGAGGEGQGSGVLPSRAENSEVAVAEPPTKAKPAPVEAPPEKPAEAVAPEPRDTSVRNAATAVDRATHGLDDLPGADHKGWEKSKAEAAEAMAKDPDYARNLAREVLQSKRPLTDAETMALGAERERLNQRFDQAENDIVKAMDANDTMAEARARSEREAALDDLDVNHRATQAGGTELARAMAARNAQITKDYSAAGLTRRARVNYGSKISPEVEAKLSEYAKKLAEQDQRIADLEAKQNRTKLDANQREQARLQKQIEAMEAKLAKRLKVCPL